MTKIELAKAIKEIDRKDNLSSFIAEADGYARRVFPQAPLGREAYKDNGFWGAMTSYMVSKAKKEGLI